ncbi:MAG: hypothetical protein DCC57_23385 [Chloroflexi bacterium]|nr:MAG: hypothetical protein DCC57_23385 [Chloroflexota bacterium]
MQEPSADSAANQVAGVVRQMVVQQLGVDAGAVSIASVEAVDWPDACLGVSQPDVMCAQVITPGYRVVIEANGQQYEYHTDATGGQIVLANAPQAQVGDLWIDWQQTQETCQALQIGSEGLAFGPCMGRMMPGRLIAPEREQELRTFLETYAPFQADTPAGAITFAGTGTTEATLAEQRMIAEWARLVRLEAESGRSGASWGLAFAWHREGGIAGFCDDLTVYVTGLVYASSCKSQPPATIGQRTLTAEELAQLYMWIDTYTSFEAGWRDPAVADAMSTKMTFMGVGEQVADAATQQAIADFAAALYTGLAQ